MTTASLPGITLHAIRGETYAMTDMGGPGPAVLLMHGWPDDRSIWRKQLPVLREADYRAVAVDWIGHGESSIPASRRRYRIPEMGRDLDALLDAPRIDRCHLVAHDYGATVCWEFAALHGHRLSSYVAFAVGPSIEILRDILGGHVLRYHRLGLDGLSRRFGLANGSRRFRSKFASHPDADRILARLEPGRDRTFWTIWEKANPAHDVILRWLTSGRKRKVRVPTMGLYGRDDEWMTEGQMRRAGRHVSGPWRFEVLDGGHWVRLERPGEVDAPLNWLGGQGQSPQIPKATESNQS